MKALKITLFLIGSIILSTQTFRHIYVNWLEPSDSVLDKYSEKVDQDIKHSKEMDELLALYDKAYHKVKAYENQNNHIEIPPNERYTKEPYQSEYKLKNSILSLENEMYSLFRVKFFWSCGLLSIILGLVCYTKINRWLGLSGIIVGFSEMICWTFPTIRIISRTVEFESLLTTKLVLSVISWVLLVSLWLFSVHIENKQRIVLSEKL